MKKLLSLIGTISIIGSGASTVVACGDDSSSSRTSESKIFPPDIGVWETSLKPAKKHGKESRLFPAQLTPDQKKADTIKKKIRKVAFTIPAGTNPDTTKTNTIKALKKALQTANPVLTSADLTTITFAKTTLKPKTAVPVQATITVGAASDTVGLKVTLLESDQQKADAIKKKIRKVALTVPAGTNPDTTKTNTIKALKQALQTANPVLTSADLNAITFAKAILKFDTAVPVQATITVGAATDTVGLKVTLLESDQQKADAIKKKIRKVAFTVPAGTNPDTTNLGTIKTLKHALQSANPALTSADLKALTFAKATLKPKTAVPVQATITVGAASDTVGLKVTLLESDKQKVADIKKKIRKVAFTVPAGTNPDTTNTNTITAIKKALQSANPALTSADLKVLTFAKATLKPSAAVPVQATITVGAARDTVVLKVTLLESDQQKADAIKKKIRKVAFTVPAGTNPDTTNLGTIKTLKHALQSANPALTSADLKALTFAKATLKPSAAVPVQATITVGAASDTVGLKVTLLESDKQKVADIKKKIRKVALNVPAGTNPDTTNTNTITAIKKALQSANPALTSADLKALTFAKATLKPSAAVPVQATITVGTAKDTVGLKVTILGSDQQKANAIRDKMQDTFLVLPQHTPAYTGNPVTIKAIKASLKKHNPTLTDDDLTTLSFSKTRISSPSPVLTTIQVNDAKAYKLIMVWSPLP